MQNAHLIAGFVLLVFSAPALAQTESEVRAAIEDQVTKFEQAYNSGNAQAMAQLYTEDAAVLPPGSPRQEGHEAIAGVWSGTMESGLADLDLTVSEVHAAGDLATEVGTFTATAPGSDGSSRADVAGKYVVLWQRGEDGTWLMHRDIWNMGQ